MKQLEIEAAIQVLKPRTEVFEAIVDPKKMSAISFQSRPGGWMRGSRWSGNFLNLT